MVMGRVAYFARVQYEAGSVLRVDKVSNVGDLTVDGAVIVGDLIAATLILPKVVL
jgi:hypothetical protein